MANERARDQVRSTTTEGRGPEGDEPGPREGTRPETVSGVEVPPPLPIGEASDVTLAECRLKLVAAGWVPGSDSGLAEAIELALYRATPTPATAEAPPGFALVPLKPNREMERLMQEEDWQWPDLLAAAGAVTEEQYDEATTSAEAPATEYSDEWLLARAKEAQRVIDSLPPALRDNLCMASATLPAHPAAQSSPSLPAEREGLVEKLLAEFCEASGTYFTEGYRPSAKTRQMISNPIRRDDLLMLIRSALSPTTPAAAQPAQQGVEAEFTDTGRAALLWVLWHHQGASSSVGQPIRFALGMGRYDRLSDSQVEQAKRWGSAASTQQQQDGGRS